MNLNNNPTIEQLRGLIQQCDDLAGSHVLWVNTSGDVELSRIPDDQIHADFEEIHQGDIKVRFEPFQAGNEYVGPDAAADEEWIAELFDSLLKRWARAKRNTGVEYVEQF